MTLRFHPLPPVPDTTAAAVRAAFPKGNLYVDLRAEFGTLYNDQLFVDLYPSEGRPVEVAPWRLALVLVMQYIEGLTDRQAADVVRRCMDWKYALSLGLTDPGFDFTLLHDFRQRLLAHEAAQAAPRQLTVRLQAHHEALQAARQRQETPEFKAQYALRAGVESSFSQGIQRFDLRRSRYIGLARTHLQQLLNATAMNMVRAIAWLWGGPLGERRRKPGHFAQLASHPLSRQTVLC
jgi:transposase